MIIQIGARNFRSLADVSVRLGALTVLVGPNGSGKSNLVDVLRFLSEALQRGLDAAIIERHGMSALRRWSAKGRPYDIEINLTLEEDGKWAEYSFILGSERRGEYRVKHEHCRGGRNPAMIEYYFETREGEWIRSQPTLNVPILPTALALPLAAGATPFKWIYDFITSMGFYVIFPNVLREPQKPANPYPLDEHGQNLASVLREIKRAQNPWLPDVQRALSKVVEDVTDFQVTQVGGYLVTRLRHRSQEDRSPTFELSQESDGTLRILGLLAALFQDPPRTLIAMEEPELTMHPGAMGLLCDVLSESTRRSQILITTHSPDLIARFGADELRVVEKVEGSTVIGEVDEAQRAAINEKLFSPGDLLRLDGSLRRAIPAAQKKNHA